MAADQFPSVFHELREIISPYEKAYRLRADTPTDYGLDSNWTRNDGYVVPFASVQIKAKYVSFHLFPLYCYPELVDDMSDALKKRKQGKSCLNFTKVDSDLFDELRALTKKGSALLDKRNPL